MRYFRDSWSFCLGTRFSWRLELFYSFPTKIATQKKRQPLQNKMAEPEEEACGYAEAPSCVASHEKCH